MHVQTTDIIQVFKQERMKLNKIHTSISSFSLMIEWRNATIPDVLKRKFATFPSSTENKVHVRI